ncbi:hypothetical protein GK047_03980 [Paenibacillus sp. SYP-B3998]|uniref:Uncharacterized protein n=1 Tax=Paenibacillus sp. SYP-B3998 TaxID=2678564 RepID=A0A6G3ZUB1_9BACL|nr:hypothetical protein [Paenibacillus sp. SYP-B3998]NEW05179.1 hypothetical protein [Paenibacillus sp. SYP-B3998]
MAEKSILAYFHSPEQAEGAVSKLKALRAIDVSIDRFGRNAGSGLQSVINPYAGDFGSLGTLTQAADISTPDEGILVAADPAASGLSDGGNGGVTGIDIVLAAVVDEGVYEQAIRVIESAGGSV